MCECIFGVAENSPGKYHQGSLLNRRYFLSTSGLKYGTQEAQILTAWRLTRNF